MTSPSCGSTILLSMHLPSRGRGTGASGGRPWCTACSSWAATARKWRRLLPLRRLGALGEARIRRTRVSRQARRLKLERRLNFGNAHEAESRGSLQRVMTEPDWKCIPDQVRDADELGYDVLLSTEIPIDPNFPLVIASQVPSQLTLGTAISVALARQLEAFDRLRQVPGATACHRCFPGPVPCDRGRGGCRPPRRRRLVHVYSSKLSDNDPSPCLKSDPVWSAPFLPPSGALLRHFPAHRPTRSLFAEGEDSFQPGRIRVASRMSRPVTQ